MELTSSSSSCLRKLLRCSWMISFGIQIIYLSSSNGFTPLVVHQQHHHRASNAKTIKSLRRRLGSHLIVYSNDDDDDNNDRKSPYKDNVDYSDLEYIDYDDPSYEVDQGIDSTDEDSRSSNGIIYDDSHAEIEHMREYRRRRNDEFQFESYFQNVLKGGDTYYGEWEVYKTSTFIPGVNDMEDGYPRVIRARDTLSVKSQGYKITVDNNDNNDDDFASTASGFDQAVISSLKRVDSERICHKETAEPLDDNASKEALDMYHEILGNQYWPEQMTAFDFRGHQGNMCVGNAHTICLGIPLCDNENNDKHLGPYAEMKTEIGIWDRDLRMRIKFDYSVLESEKEAYLIQRQEQKDDDDESTSIISPPPLRLKSMTVCRETVGQWPTQYFKNNNNNDEDDEDGLSSFSKETRKRVEALFGLAGAAGGLYDPPPVGKDDQAEQYMMLDLDGGATTLFPYLMDQDKNAFGGNGWVTSLDWSPGAIRFQVDRKVQGGDKILGLRTLELSEVETSQADKYRPRGNPTDMLQ